MHLLRPRCKIRIKTRAAYTSGVDGLLKGIRVLDLSRVLAGPYCTMILGDMGAEVIKVEHPTQGDDTRSWGPPFLISPDKKHSMSAYFITANRNKHSITINLKSEKGKQIIYDLAKQCDVLVENYLPGKLDEMGYGYAELSALNPGLVYASITGYGSTGPDCQRPGYDAVIQAEGGLMSITGQTNGDPTKVGVAVTDLQTGLYAHGAILAALLARTRTGKGQKIDVSLLETQVASLANVASNFLVSGMEGKRYGNAHSSIVPYELFKTKPDPKGAEESGVMITAGNEKQWAILCQVLGKTEWIKDPRMSSNANRVKNRVFVVKAIQDEVIHQTSDFWMEKFKAAGLAAGPYNTVANTFSHPQVVHRKMIEEIEHPNLGTIKMVGIPVKYSLNEPKVVKPPPLLGEDTHFILSSYLGMNDEQIQALRDERVI